MPSEYLLVSGGSTLLILFIQTLAGTYSSWRGRDLAEQLTRVYVSWIATAGILTLIGFALKTTEHYSRIWFITAGLFGLAQVTLARLSWAWLLRTLRTQGRNLKGVVLVDMAGSPHRIHSQLDTLGQHGYHVKGQISVTEAPGWLDTLTEAVAACNAREVWICLPIEKGGLVKPISYALRYLTVEIRYLPEMGNIPLLNYRARSIAGLYAVDISCSPMNGLNRVVKRAEDLLLGGLITLMILPVCAIVALAVRLTSKGPALFRQKRMGFNGRTFRVYKFRTMVVHTEAAGHVTQAQHGDLRITRLGAFLRRTSLDELPQFFNVLLGDMSIVGPRPHALVHNEQYKELVHSYMKRHKVKPGITGWAQVNGYRGVTDTLEKMERRVECDLWYINNWSLWLDLRIIFWTVFKGFLNREP
ncbi:Putative colanic acid biosynthesis UDP-glucose lipid carrier transferase OS=Castellaniella defragrans OX=75697 GN=HNR28_001323 PE=3 SV=1 [Castellaniella defragrans]